MAEGACATLQFAAHYTHAGPGAVPRIALYSNTRAAGTALPMVYCDFGVARAAEPVLALQIGGTDPDGAPALLGAVALEPYANEDGRVVPLAAGGACMPLSDALGSWRAGRAVVLRISSFMPEGGALARGTLTLRIVDGTVLPERMLGPIGARASVALTAPSAVLRAELGACIARAYEPLDRLPFTMRASTARRIVATTWALGDVDVPFAAYWCADGVVPPRAHYLAHLLAIGAAREGLDAAAGAAALAAGAVACESRARGTADARAEAAIAQAARIYVGALTARATVLPYLTDLVRAGDGRLRKVDHFDPALAAKDCEDFARIIYFMHNAFCAAPSAPDGGAACGAVRAAAAFASCYVAAPLLCAVTQLAASAARGHDNEEAYAAHMTVLLVPRDTWREWRADAAPLAAQPGTGGVLVAEGTGFVPPELIPDAFELARQDAAARVLCAPGLDALPHEMLAERADLAGHRSSFFRIALFAWVAEDTGGWAVAHRLMDRQTGAVGVRWDELDIARVHAVPLARETDGVIAAARARLVCEAPEDAPAPGAALPIVSTEARSLVLAGHAARVWVPLANDSQEQVARARAQIETALASLPAGAGGARPRLVCSHLEVVDTRVRPDSVQLCAFIDTASAAL